MKLRIADKDYILRFQYSETDANVKFTSAIITIGNKIVVTGESRCSEGDNFSKIKGRRIALLRALNKSFTRTERQEIFQQLQSQGMRIA